MSNCKCKIREVNSSYYHRVIDNFLDGDLRAFLYPKFKSNHFYLLFDNDVAGGFCTNSNGILEGIFSLNGEGDKVLKLAIEQIKKDYPQNKTIKVFLIGDFLKEYYLKNGFIVNGTFNFNRDLAQKNWNYKRFGTPKLYKMFLPL